MFGFPRAPPGKPTKHEPECPCLSSRSPACGGKNGLTGEATQASTSRSRFTILGAMTGAAFWSFSRPAQIISGTNPVTASGGIHERGAYS